jgi:hypothetical protein
MWSKRRGEKIPGGNSCKCVPVPILSTMVEVNVLTEPDSTISRSQPPVQRRPKLAGFPGENQGVVPVVRYKEPCRERFLRCGELIRRLQSQKGSREGRET